MGQFVVAGSRSRASAGGILSASTTGPLWGDFLGRGAGCGIWSTEKRRPRGPVLAVVGPLGCPPGGGGEGGLVGQGVEHQGEHLGVDNALIGSTGVEVVEVAKTSP